MTNAEHDVDVRVYVIDDHSVVRSGLRALIAGRTGMRVVGDAASGEDALNDLAATRELDDVPNVVVTDLMMPGIGGIETIKRLSDVHPEIRVLVLTMNEDIAYVRAALAAGAVGFVLKDVVDVELLDALQIVAAGGRYVHPKVERELAMVKDGRPFGLSEREVEVLRLIAAGYSNKEIAEELVLSVRTIESHRTNIIGKTGMRARSDLVRFASENGLLTG